MVTSLGIVPVIWMKLTFDCLLGFFWARVIVLLHTVGDYQILAKYV